MAGSDALRRKKFQRFEDTKSFAVLRKRYDSRKQTLFEKAIQLEISTRCKVLLVVFPPLLLPTAETHCYVTDESLEKSVLKPGIVNKKNYSRIDRRKWLAEMGQEVECGQPFANVTDDAKFSQPCDDPDSEASATKADSSCPTLNAMQNGKSGIRVQATKDTEQKTDGTKDTGKKCSRTRKKGNTSSQSQETESAEVLKCITQPLDDQDLVRREAKRNVSCPVLNGAVPPKTSTGAKRTKGTVTEFRGSKKKGDTSSHPQTKKFTKVSGNSGSNKDLSRHAGGKNASRENEEPKSKTKFQPCQHKFATNEDLARDVKREMARKKANVKVKTQVTCSRRVPYDSTSSSDTDSDSSDSDGGQIEESKSVSNFSTEQTHTTITVISEGDVKDSTSSSASLKGCVGRPTKRSWEKIGGKSKTTAEHGIKEPEHRADNPKASESVTKEQHHGIGGEENNRNKQSTGKCAQKVEVSGLGEKAVSGGNSATENGGIEGGRCNSQSVSLQPGGAAKVDDKKTHCTTQRPSKPNTYKPKTTQTKTDGGKKGLKRNSGMSHSRKGSMKLGQASQRGRGISLPKKHNSDQDKTKNYYKRARSRTWNCTRQRSLSDSITSKPDSKQGSHHRLVEDVNHAEGQNLGHPQKNCTTPLANIKQERNPYEWVPNATKGVKRTGSSTLGHQLPSKMRSLCNNNNTDRKVAKECPPPYDKSKLCFTDGLKTPRSNVSKHVHSSGNGYLLSPIHNSNRMHPSDTKQKNDRSFKAYSHIHSHGPVQSSFLTKTEPRFRCDGCAPRLGRYTKQYEQPFRSKLQSWHAGTDNRYRQGKQQWSMGPRPHNFGRENQKYYW